MTNIPSSIARLAQNVYYGSGNKGAATPVPKAYAADGTASAPVAELRRFHFALAQRAYAPCDVLIIGDSISEGTGATVRSRRWVDQFQKRMRELYPTTGVNGGEGFVKGSYSQSVTYPYADGWTYGGNLSGNGTFGFGRSCVVLKGPDGSMWRPFTGTSIKVLFMTSSTLGNVEVRYVAHTGSAPTFPVSANATASATSGTSAAALNGSLTVTFPSRGTYDVQIKHVAATTGAGSGDVFINGVWAYDGDENAGVRITESAQHGSTSANWTPGAALPNSSTNQDSYAMTAGIALLNPALVIIGLGGNDRTTSVPVSTYKANINSLIQVINDNVSPDPSIVLLGEYQEGTSAEEWTDFLAAQQSIADAHTNVYFYSLYDRFPLASDNVLNWVYTDGVHPSDRGHATIAEFVAGELRPR